MKLAIKSALVAMLGFAIAMLLIGWWWYWSTAGREFFNFVMVALPLIFPLWGMAHREMKREGENGDL